MTYPPLDMVFNSVSKVRILLTLAIHEELNITAISEIAGLNYSRLLQHLKELKDLGILQEKRFGRIKIYSFHNTNEAASKIKGFFKEWISDSSDPYNSIFKFPY